MVPPPSSDSLKPSPRVPCMVARVATLAIFALLCSGQQRGLEKDLDQGTCLAYRPQAFTGQEEVFSSLETTTPEQEAIATSCALFGPASRVNCSEGSLAGDFENVVVPLLQSQHGHAPDEMQHVLLALAASPMEATGPKTLPVQIQGGQEEGWRIKRKRSLEPLRHYGNFRREAVLGGTVDSVVPVDQDTIGKTRSRKAEQRYTYEAARRKRISGPTQDCAGAQWRAKGDQGSSPKGNHSQHGRPEEPSTTRTSIQSGQFEKRHRKAPYQDEGVGCRVDYLCKSNERKVHFSKEGISGIERPDDEGHGREETGSAGSSSGFEEASNAGSDTHHRPGKRSNRRCGFPMGCGPRDASPSTAGRQHKASESTEQEGEAREMREGHLLSLGCGSKFFADFCTVTSHENRTFSVAPFFKAAADRSRRHFFVWFSQLIGSLREWQEGSLTGERSAGFWGDFFDEVMKKPILFIPVIIGGNFFLMILYFLWEVGEDEVIQWRCLVKVSNRRINVKRKTITKGFSWTRWGIHYLLWWHQTGVLAGNSMPQRNFDASLESQVQDQDFLGVFRSVQDRRFHVFELWMHKPTWDTDFVQYKRLISIDMGKPHMRQIEESWRGNENWEGYDLVQVRLPSTIENFQGFMGKRYIAYPEGNTERTPLMVHFNGIRKIMTGTVWLKNEVAGLSTQTLFDILEPQNQCGDRHLCSVRTEELVFWPERFPVTHGLYLHAKQVDLHDGDDSPGTQEGSDCTTTWYESGNEKTSTSTFEPHENQGERYETDLHSMMQRQMAAGNFPDRMRQRSTRLWEMVMATTQTDPLDERELVENTVAVYDAHTIWQEIEALASGRDGRVTFQLLGIADHSIGMRAIMINVWELQDLLDVIVQIRREWMRHVNLQNFNIYYVNPQPPLGVQLGEDSIVLMCDFQPGHPRTPIAILTITHFDDEDVSMDLSVHRVNMLVTCKHLQEASGLMMVCERNAECECTHAGRTIEDNRPIIVFGGLRLDLDARFAQNLCAHNERAQNDEETSLMQSYATHAFNHGPWLYGYPLLARDAIRMWKGAIGQSTPERLLANEYARLREMLHHQMHVYPVVPVPRDLAERNIEPYVIAANGDFEIWHVIVLIDLFWEQEAHGGTGGTFTPLDEWRATRAIDFQLTAETFLRQLGLGAFCGDHHEFCLILVRGIPWVDGTLRFNSGEYITVKIRRSHSNIPLGTQWQLSQSGCRFEQMHERLGPSREETTASASTQVPGGGDPSSQTVTNATGLPIERENEGHEEHEGHEAEDETALMQQQPNEEWFFVYVKGMHDPIAEKLVGQEIRDPILAIRNRLAIAIPDVPRNFLMVFMVVTQPEDLQRMRTSAVIHAKADEIPRGKVLAMLDIEFYENEKPRMRHDPSAIDEWREVLELTEYQTRSELLAQTGLQSFCDKKGTVYA